MQFTIRPIELADNSIIAGIIRGSLSEFGANKPGTVFFDPTTDHLFELFRQPGSAYFIAEENGEIIGGGGIYPTQGLPDKCCELVKLYLDKSARGKGIGSKLISLCLEKAKEFGYTQVYLETMPELPNAVTLYKKLGFNNLDGPLGESGHFGCDLWMLKLL